MQRSFHQKADHRGVHFTSPAEHPSNRTASVSAESSSSSIATILPADWRALGFSREAFLVEHQ